MTAGAIYGLAATPAFTFTRLDAPALEWTTTAELTSAVAVPTGTNLFRLRVGPIESRIRDLPAVAGASVTVSLPDTLVVTVTERTPILVWAAGKRRFLVDRDGVLFADISTGPAVAADLPAVTDARADAAGLDVGSRLDPVDLDASTRLASLVPADVGSVASALRVSVSDANGYVVTTTPASWAAVFGLYTPTLRPPDLIPAQVRLLGSLLRGREASVATVILADGERGTYVPADTPEPSAP